MSSDFKTYIIVLNKQAWKNKKLSDLDKLLKSLKEKENQMKITITVAAVHSKRKEYKDRDRKDREDFDWFNFWKNDDSNRLYCQICFYNHEKKQCYHIKMKCFKYYKTDYIQRNCSKLTSLTLQSNNKSIEQKQIINIIRNTIAQFSFIENTKFVD